MTRRHAHAEDHYRPRPTTEQQVEGLALFAEPLRQTLPAEPKRTPQAMALAYAPGSDTSEDAAEAMASRAEVLREAILRLLLAHDNLTPDEAAELLGESVLSVRPRFTELGERGLGWIERSGERRVNASGMRAHAMRLTDAGRRRAA